MRALPEQILHRPFDQSPYRLAMDLVTVPEDGWFEIDQQYPSEMAEKRRLLATVHDQVFAALPASDAARTEALELIAAALARHHPSWFSFDNAMIRNHLTEESWTIGSGDPLELAARLVQEDLCLIQLTADVPVFSASVLCFPSRWRLMEKIGKPLLQVHERVPSYAERLGGPVDRFMRHLKPGHIVSRLNWSLLDDPALFQPGGKWRTDDRPDITTANAGNRVFLRVERQTLRRLPRSMAILFGIRVHAYPLSRAIDQPATARILAAAVEALPDAVQRYKSVLPFREALMGWLQDRMS